MLTEGHGLVDALHLCEDFFVEERWNEDVSWVLLDICLVCRVSIAQLLSLWGLPLLWSDEAWVEDLFCVDLNQATISIVSDTPTVVGLSDQILDSLPWELSLSVVVFRRFVVLQSSHVNGKQILAHRVIRVIEVVRDVPTESLELLALNQDGMEPAESIHGLSKCSVLIHRGELAHVVELSQHVCLDTLGWLLGDLERPLQERDGEVRMGTSREEKSEAGIALLLEDVIDH